MRIAIAAILLGAATMAAGPSGPAAGKTRPCMRAAGHVARYCGPATARLSAFPGVLFRNGSCAQRRTGGVDLKVGTKSLVSSRTNAGLTLFKLQLTGRSHTRRAESSSRTTSPATGREGAPRSAATPEPGRFERKECFRAEGARPGASGASSALSGPPRAHLGTVKRCARQDSNLRPLPPQGSALSPELRARGGQV